MERTYRIGTRKSPLALKQVEEVLGLLRKSRSKALFEIVKIDTFGDKDRATPVSDMEGSDFFTKEIEEALLAKEIDCAVHSAKDLPDRLKKGLDLTAITPSVDPYDVLVSKGGLRLHELPRGARIGTSSMRRKEALKRYRSDFQIVDIRGNIEERLSLLDDRSRKGMRLDAIVIAAAGLVRLGLKHRITEKIPFDILKPHPLQGALAVEVRESDKESRELFGRLDARKKGIGKVYLVGGGPGDPGLITVKGLKALQASEVVVYDRLIDKRILQYAGPDAELICADELNKGKYEDGFCKRQDLINRLLIKKAKEGKRVLRLKNGDPFIFGRANEEIEDLVKEGVAFSVIPGITAANAASCQAGIPLTTKDLASSVTFVTGHEAPNKKSLIDWKSIAGGGTVVLYMAVGNISKITKELISSGKDRNTPVAVVSDVSKIDQRTVIGSLSNIAEKIEEENLTPPAIAIIGRVVEKEDAFNWFRKSKKVLFTGLSEERPYEKDLIFHLPLIKIEPLEDYSELDELIKKIGMFDWVVFTSRFGVMYFFERLFKLDYDTRSLGGAKIAAIGSSTARKLKEFGVSADLVPKEESSHGLLGEFRRLHTKGDKILLPRSDIADKGLTDGLKALGAEVYATFAYRNVMPHGLPDLDLSGFDEIMFTSPSTVRNFKTRYGRVPGHVKITCIGDVTLKEAERCKLLD